METLFNIKKNKYNCGNNLSSNNCSFGISTWVTSLYKKGFWAVRRKDARLYTKLSNKGRRRLTIENEIVCPNQILRNQLQLEFGDNSLTKIAIEP